MNNAYKPPLILFALVVALVLITMISKMGSGNDLVPWRHSLSDAQAEAGRVNKPVFAYFTATWCGPCQSLKRTTWSAKNVASAMEGYVPVKLDVDEEGTLAQKYGVSSIPMFIIMDAQGQVKQSTSGAMGAEEMVSWLKQGQ